MCAHVCVSVCVVCLSYIQVREIYESAIEAEDPYDLPDTDTRKLVLRYAELERKLGEVSRHTRTHTRNRLSVPLRR